MRRPHQEEEEVVAAVLAVHAAPRAGGAAQGVAAQPRPLHTATLSRYLLYLCWYLLLASLSMLCRYLLYLCWYLLRASLSMLCRYLLYLCRYLMLASLSRYLLTASLSGILRS